MPTASRGSGHSCRREHRGGGGTSQNDSGSSARQVAVALVNLNAANRGSVGGGGADGAIHEAAGDAELAAAFAAGSCEPR